MHIRKWDEINCMTAISKTVLFYTLHIDKIKRCEINLKFSVLVRLTFISAS